MWWMWILIGGASLMVLQSLASLMVAYRQKYLSELFEEEVNRRQRELEAQVAAEAARKADFGKRKPAK